MASVGVLEDAREIPPDGVASRAIVGFYKGYVVRADFLHGTPGKKGGHDRRKQRREEMDGNEPWVPPSGGWRAASDPGLYKNETRDS